jgi:Family of unknown function (DUF6011)
VKTWVFENAAKNDFARSLSEYIAKHGELTEGQRAAVERNLAKAANASAPKPEINIAGIEAAFAAAAAKGKKRLAIFVGGFKFSPAPANGRNGGSIYVKRDETYLGKISGGKFFKAYECKPEDETAVVAEAAKVTDFESLKVIGRNTGVCCICGVELTDPDSIAAGIGPICATRGW